MKTLQDLRGAPREDVRSLSAYIKQTARPLRRGDDLDPLMDRIGDARYVLIGEATHGTSEFYNWRARLSQRLIVEKGFTFVGVEGDWPDCYRVNRYARGLPDSGESADDVLHAFDRWPTWMWANREVVEFAEWLRGHNNARPDDEKVGFYGLDVYSLWDSLRAVVGYLDKVDGEAAKTAREAYRCFEPFHDDVQGYAWHTAMTPETCEDEVVKMLVSLRAEAPQFRNDGREAYFNAEQNALVAKNAERYYRAMIRSGSGSWNVRDYHMAETLDRLMTHQGPESKAIVWEHNTHIGDARATDMAGAGMQNIGEIARERHADEGVVLVGFGSHHGSVIAGAAWDAPMERMTVPDAISGSWEDVFHEAGLGDCMLLMNEADHGRLAPRRGHRAIGVVYDPYRERGNYVPTVLPDRYDAFLFIDESHALHPLHLKEREEHEVPETYPTAV